MKTNLPIYEAQITGTENGIFAMSFVDFPANEQNFVALTKTKAVRLHLNKQKQVLTGAVLVPDQMIYRNDDQLGEYYLRFTAADIEKAAERLMSNGVALRTTTHQHERQLRGNYLIECWIVVDPKRDKSVALGLGEVPKGTLMASYKVTNTTYWRTQVATGNVKGFSIEGLFNFKNVTMKKPLIKKGTLVHKAAPGAKPTLVQKAAALLSAAAAMLEGDTAAAADDLVDEAKKDETDSGEPMLIFDLADGGEIDVDSEGFCTMDGEQAPAGDHQLADGNFISIGDDGMFVESTEEPENVDPEAAPAALSADQIKKRKEAKLRAAKLLKGEEVTAPAKKAAGKNSTEIAKLKAQIAKLEAAPTTDKAKPKTESNKGAKDVADMKPWEKAAVALKARQNR